MTSSRFAVLSLIAVTFALQGCRAMTGSCHDPQVYQQAQSAKPLQIPAGLESPDTRNALAIPDLKEPAPPARKEGDACLDQPPSYRTAKPTPPDA
jgi:uncharacterized lipoprotein